MPHLVIALIIAMSGVISLHASAEEIFSVSKNRQFVPRCSNRNNPGELHSSVETCITRRPHWGSPSWRRLHLGINPEDTFTGEVHSKTSFLDTVPNSLTGEVNSNSSSLAKLSTGLVMFLQRFCFIASCYPGVSQLIFAIIFEFTVFLNYQKKRRKKQNLPKEKKKKKVK